jgi:HAD superfamily hydrolase (TIGR01484 family)
MHHPLQNVRCLFTDIDDTISTHGKITQEAYDALWRAHHAGLTIVPVTGRPAGWCDHIARMWPVDGVIGENGGLYMRMTGQGYLAPSRGKPPPHILLVALGAFQHKIARPLNIKKICP